MITAEKIEQWIKEVQERPGSAPTIVQYIANRLWHLAERNEELLNENIALRSGKRVEEYERRIKHLEYQLDLLRRQYQEGKPIRAAEPEPETPASGLLETISVLVYDAQGRVLRKTLGRQDLQGETGAVVLVGDLQSAGKAPGLLAVPTVEDVLFVFSSGRISRHAVVGIPPALPGPDAVQLAWDKAPILEPPKTGEELVCLAPLARLALVDYFVQVSRRGYLKKINISMAESILANHYIGTGVKQPSDQTAAVLLCQQDEELLLLSEQGYCLAVEVESLSYAISSRMQLSSSDHLVEAVRIEPGQSLLAATQIGKLVHRTQESLETEGAQKARGLSLYSATRRSQGVRVIGAAAVSEQDWCLALYRDGRLSWHTAGELFESRSIAYPSELIAFSACSSPYPPANQQER